LIWLAVIATNTVMHGPDLALAVTRRTSFYSRLGLVWAMGHTSTTALS